MDKKKIMGNSLDMDELEQVSGGNIDECINDLMLFEKRVGLKLYTSTWSRWGITFPTADKASIARLTEAFAKFDVKVDFALGNNKISEAVFNDYYINGKLSSHEEVWEHITAKVAAKNIAR